MLAEAALGVPALMIGSFRKMTAHGAAVRRLRPSAACVAAVEADDCLSHAQLLAAEAVVVLGVLARVAQGGIDVNQACSLAHGRSEVGRVLARSNARHRAEDEMGRHMEDGRQLWPGALPVPLSPASQPEIGTDVARLEPRRVHSGDRRRIDQAAPMGTPDHHGLSAAEGPPASASARMRREAWASVE